MLADASAKSENVNTTRTTTTNKVGGRASVLEHGRVPPLFPTIQLENMN